MLRNEAPTEGGKRGRGTDKTPVLVGLSINKQGYPLYLKMQVIPDVKKDTVLEFAHTFIGLDVKHLQAYLNEFCYRFNRRHFKGELFNRLLKSCVSTSTITFTELMA